MRRYLQRMHPGTGRDSPRRSPGSRGSRQTARSAYVPIGIARCRGACCGRRGAGPLPYLSVRSEFIAAASGDYRPLVPWRESVSLVPPPSIRWRSTRPQRTSSHGEARERTYPATSITSRTAPVFSKSIRAPQVDPSRRADALSMGRLIDLVEMLVRTGY